MIRCFAEIEKEVSGTNTLIDLFSLWKAAHVADTSWKDNFPIKDGVIPGEQFKPSFCPDGVTSISGNYCGEEKADVLFLLKESNAWKGNPNAVGDSDKSFWFNEPRPDYGQRQRKRYGNSFSAVLNQYDPNWTPETAIGYMNLNKRGGASRANSKRIKSYVRQYHAFILKEIELISPKTIFLCGCRDDFENAIPGEHLHESSQDGNLHFSISETVDPLIVPIYHPAYSGFRKCLENIQVNT